MNAIIQISESSLQLARKLADMLPDSQVLSLKELDSGNFNQFENIVFIGAMGICVRCIAPYIKDKYTDPAVVCLDSMGKYVIPVLSGHIGGANELAREIAQASWWPMPPTSSG